LQTFLAIKRCDETKIVEVINSLAAIGGDDRQFFDKLLWGLVTSTFFVRW
jgi:hypothetical protein